MIKKFNEFSKLNEDSEGGSSGTAISSLGNTSGMGAVVSAQPSSTPGSVWGLDATKGSGDIGTPIGTYTKAPVKNVRRNRKDKKNRSYNKIGAGIDDFYVSKYVQDSKGGRVIQNWQTFTDSR